MNPDSTAEELHRVFGKVFEGTAAAEHTGMRRGTYPWSSLRHIELVNTIESVFEVQLSVEDVLRAEDFESLILVLKERSFGSRTR